MKLINDGMTSRYEKALPLIHPGIVDGYFFQIHGDAIQYVFGTPARSHRSTEMGSLIISGGMDPELCHATYFVDSEKELLEISKLQWTGYQADARQGMNLTDGWKKKDVTGTADTINREE